MRPTKGSQKETGQLGGFNDETGAQSRVHTNRNRLLLGSRSNLFSLILGSVVSKYRRMPARGKERRRCSATRPLSIDRPAIKVAIDGYPASPHAMLDEGLTRERVVVRVLHFESRSQGHCGLATRMLPLHVTIRSAITPSHGPVPPIGAHSILQLRLDVGFPNRATHVWVENVSKVLHLDATDSMDVRLL